MNEIMKWLSKLYLWQISIVIALFLLVLGFTGDIPYVDIELRPGRSQQAITGGTIFFLLGINLKLMMMLIERKNGNHKGE